LSLLLNSIVLHLIVLHPHPQELYTQAIPEIRHFQANPSAVSNLPNAALKLLAWVIDPEPFDGMHVEKISLAQVRTGIARPC